jgi:O-methyltransferase involved in polyketide biosynthesis
MVVASGLFYYFQKNQVIDFINHLAVFSQVQLTFDAISSAGMKVTRRL